AGTWRGGDLARWPPGPGQPAIEVEVVSNGFHSGLALPSVALAESAERQALPRLTSVLRRFEGASVLEIGWGEARFYRATPTLGSIDWALGLSALFRPGNASVIHVVGLPGRARSVLLADTVAVSLTQSGFDAVARRIERSLAGSDGGAARLAGPGLAPMSLFYEAERAFSVLNLCNHWMSDLLAEAGLPTVRAWATLPDGLIFALRVRSGLAVQPARQ
ncbi:DUF2459 domain-containing protein, partial [Nostoc sp. NIES-2111]